MKLATIKGYIENLPDFTPGMMETCIENNTLMVFFNYDQAGAVIIRHEKITSVQNRIKRLADVFPVAISYFCFPYPHSTLCYDIKEVTR